MANVKVIIEEIVKGEGNVKKVTNDLNNMEKTVKSSDSSTSKLKASFTEFNSALSLVTQGFRYVGQAIEATSGKTVEYANQVRLLGQINGQSAESNSRLIQTLDDYKVSVDDITTASRKLKDNGLSPTVDTVAKLAEQYQNIKDPAEKLKFAQDNLGKSSKAWLEVLSQSPDILREQAAGISENLILTQKQIDAARQLELAEDAKNDALQGVATTLGNKLIPIQTKFYNGVNVLIRGIEIAKERHIGLAEATDIAGQEIWQEQQNMLKLTEAADESSVAVDDLSAAQASAEETAKSLSSVYSGLLSSMFSIQNANDSYNKSVEDMAKKDEDLENKKKALTLQMWQEQQAGKLTNEENLRYVQQLAEITAAQEENAQAKKDIEAENKKASEQRVYDLAQQKLAADGVVTSGEYEYLQDLAVNYGLVSRAAADQAISEEKRASALVSSFEQTLPPAEQSLQVLSALAALNGTVVDFRVNYQSNAPKSASSSNIYQNYANVTSNPQAQAGGYAYQYQSRDNGGVGIAGTPYMIGTGAQPEVFTPSTNGTFTPANKIGATYNIVVNNPKKETAENSIRDALKRLSYTGAAV